MIADLLDRWSLYFDAPIWRDAFEFVQSLDADAEEKRYDLRGDDLFVIVAGYETKPPAEAVFEAHQRYIDVQTLLAGEEALDWAAVERLAEREAYDAEKDCAFYAGDAQGRLTLRPGVFAALFPRDAHAPGLSLGPFARPVKKAVVKIRVQAAARDRA